MGWAKSMPFASINPTNPRTNPWNFHEKILRIGGAGKWVFFEAAILNFLSRPFWIFFCFISVKNPALLYEVSFFSALWIVFPESWKRRCPNFYAHDCIYIHSWLTTYLSKNLMNTSLMSSIYSFRSQAYKRRKGAAAGTIEIHETIAWWTRYDNQ